MTKYVSRNPRLNLEVGKRFFGIICLLLANAVSTRAGELTFEAETGAVWFSQNEVRIPGDTGTKFDMLDLTGSGPEAYIRLYATYAFNERHSLRLTFAPLEAEGTGTLPQETTFEDAVFSPDIPTKGTYKFNTYRLTYQWTFYHSERWRWGVGAALLVRDAKIVLQQGDINQSSDDLGVVPLLHLYGAYRWTDEFSLILDAEGLAAPQGRAFDVAFKAQYQIDPNWYASIGYRTLEGGADNDEVYNFAWLHYALIEVGYSF